MGEASDNQDMEMTVAFRDPQILAAARRQTLSEMAQANRIG